MTLKEDLIKLTDERNEWQTRCEFSFAQRDKLTAERDAYAAAADDMAAAHKVERDKHCNCEFEGDENTVQCTLHNAWAETLHEQAGFRRERDALKADAERYRYLRSKQMQYSLPNNTVAMLLSDMTALDATMKEIK